MDRQNGNGRKRKNMKNAENVKNAENAKKTAVTFTRPVIMGILNVTPDSFSDGGRYDKPEAALKQAEKMIREGADIIDIGGESTRPGYTMIFDGEEISRVVPVIRALKKEFPDVTLSLDTYKSGVAEAGLSEGIQILNDIWGLKWNLQAGKSPMAAVLARYPAAKAVIMHNRKEDRYDNLLEDILSDLQESIRLGLEAGMKRENMISDPGVGFAKTTEENLITIREVGRLLELDLPILLGISRKSVIGNTLNLPKDQREEGTVALNVYGYLQGCSIFRVHDVEKNRRALDMIAAVAGAGK